MAIFTDRLTRARMWRDWQTGVIPLQPNSKHIVQGFGSRQGWLTTDAQLVAWFGERSANVGIVLDRGLVCADFDDASQYWSWVAGPGAGIHTYTELTARGAHVLWRGEGLPAGVGGGCEFKNAGAVMVAPSVHPSGIVYKILCDLPPQSLSLEQAISFFPFLAKPKPETPRAAPAAAAVSSERPNMLDTIKAKVSVIDELTAAGVKSWGPGKTTVVACCPFHPDTRPSLWVVPARGVWGCNVPSCKAFGKHDVINARALRRGLTVPEAIREMWAEVRP